MYFFTLTLITTVSGLGFNSAKTIDDLSLLKVNGTLKGPGDLELVSWEDCRSSSSTYEYCLNCAVAITCLDPGKSDVAAAEWCPLQQSCDSDYYSTCHNQPVSQCLCSTGIDYQLDPLGVTHNDESWYMKCNVDGFNIHYRCEDGFFNTTDHQCRYCPVDKPVVSRTDCYTYITCIRDGLYISHGIQRCPSGMFISDNLSKCVNSAGSFKCTEAGDFKDPFDCHRYQTCSEEAAIENGMSSPVCCDSENEVFVEGVGCIHEHNPDCSYTNDCSDTVLFCYGGPTPPTTVHPNTTNDGDLTEEEGYGLFDYVYSYFNEE